MSYLETLQRIRQQGSPFEQFTSSFGEAASTVASIAAQQRQREEQERQRRRQQAQQQAEILQRQGAIAFQSGNLDAASRIAQRYQNALREGYDLQPSVEVPLGTPIIQQLAKPVAPTPMAGPDFGPEPPGGMATMGPFMREPRAPLGPKTPMMGAPTPRAPRIPEPREVGRVFEGPQVRQDLRSALMMAPTPPIRVGDALYFPDEQRFVEAPQEMRQPQQRMGWVRGAGGVETYRELVPGMVSLPPPRAPREPREPREPALTEVFDPNLNAMVVVPKRAGMVKPLPPVRVAMQDEQGNVVYVAQQPIAQPAGKGFRRPQAPRKASVAKPLTAQDMSRINDMAYDELARTTPGMIGDKRMIVMALQRDPALRARHASIVKGMADSIMSDRRAAAEAENASVGIKTPQQPAAPQRKSKILELLGG